MSPVLVETGSRLDEVVYEEFNGTGNWEVRLSRELADRASSPLSILGVSTPVRKSDLLSENELRATSIVPPPHGRSPPPAMVPNR